MRKANVYRNSTLVGTLTQFSPSSFEFSYDDKWLTDMNLPAVSLTIPKSRKIFTSEYLFPFFFNMLSEGANRKLQSRQLKIDEKDYFGLLLATAKTDTIGAITLTEVK